MSKKYSVILNSIIFAQFLIYTTPVTMKQFEASLDMLSSICAPKFSVKPEALDALRKGIFEEDREIKCYTKCIGQVTGTLTRKGELSYQKVVTQINTILPESIKEMARKALDACIDVQNSYADDCDKMFYVTKCVYDFAPESFMFP